MEDGRYCLHPQLHTLPAGMVSVKYHLQAYILHALSAAYIIILKTAMGLHRVELCFLIHTMRKATSSPFDSHR